MEFGGNMFCLGNRDQNGNNNSNSFAWDSWEITTSPGTAGSSASKGLTFLPQADVSGCVDQNQLHELSQVHLDPHLMCLKLGKRHYFEASLGGGGSGEGLCLADKRGKGYCGSGGKGTPSLTAATTVVPKCQVEGCHVALLNAKEYHRRHKVCEMHSKAPKVVVLGMEQRFCQQCSRFHVVSEFDDSKRSCRRRLAGHNERRRKSSHDSVSRNTSQGGCALSLLSSRSDSWLSRADLSIRCSAALRELIAENRAAAHMARQLILDRDFHLHHHAMEDFKVMQPAESSHFPQHLFRQSQ